MFGFEYKLLSSFLIGYMFSSIYCIEFLVKNPNAKMTEFINKSLFFTTTQLQRTDFGVNFYYYNNYIIFLLSVIY